MVSKREQLTPEELAVITKRYDLQLPAPQVEITDEERRDQLEASALRKLRHQTLEAIQSWRQAV